jgi:hypothetical protein
MPAIGKNNGFGLPAVGHINQRPFVLAFLNGLIGAEFGEAIAITRFIARMFPKPM